MKSHINPNNPLSIFSKRCQNQTIYYFLLKRSLARKHRHWRILFKVPPIHALIAGQVHFFRSFFDLLNWGLLSMKALFEELVWVHMMYVTFSVLMLAL